MIDNDEFLRLVYLLAKQHFNDCGIEVDLVKYDEYDADKPHVSFYMFKESDMFWIYSRTSATISNKTRVLNHGAAPYIINKFSLEKSKNTHAIAVNKSNFELLKMLTSLNREEMELWLRIR